MKEISIKKQPITIDRKEKLTRNLMCAVLIQAVKDYVDETASTNKLNLPEYYFDKDVIINDLKSDRIVALTNGLSLTVAHALQTNSDQIKENLQNIIEDFDLAKVEMHDTPQY